MLGFFSLRIFIHDSLNVLTLAINISFIGYRLAQLTLTELLISQMTEVLKAGVLSDEIDLGALAHNAAEQAEEFVRKVRCHIIFFVKYNLFIFS